MDLLFNERALPTALVPNRDLGVELHGELLEGVASYAAGVFNGVGDARNSSNFDFEDRKALEGRVFFQPFKQSSLAVVVHLEGDHWAGLQCAVRKEAHVAGVFLGVE